MKASHFSCEKAGFYRVQLEREACSFDANKSLSCNIKAAILCMLTKVLSGSFFRVHQYRIRQATSLFRGCNSAKAIDTASKRTGNTFHNLKQLWI